MSNKGLYALFSNIPILQCNQSTFYINLCQLFWKKMDVHTFKIFMKLNFTTKQLFMDTILVYLIFLVFSIANNFPIDNISLAKLIKYINPSQPSDIGNQYDNIINWFFYRHLYSQSILIFLCQTTYSLICSFIHSFIHS